MQLKTPQQQTSRYESIDEVLGPRETRFFGEGFRRVRHRLRDISVFPGEGNRPALTSRAGVIYPTDWSRKGSMDQQPHLSTIDVLVIAAQLSELLLAHDGQLSHGERHAAVLRSIHIKAGRSPVERELADFGVTGHILGTRCDAGMAKTRTSCSVGKLHAESEIIHPATAAEPAATGCYGRTVPDDPAGDARRSLYSGGFRQRRQFLRDVMVEPSEHRARARLRTIFSRAATGRCDGLDAKLYFSASPVDCFVSALQLGQLLLYGLDRVPRADSSTLWMRETTLEMDPERDPLPAVTQATAALHRLRLLENSIGEVWRSADIVGELHGTRVRCSVAHRLPSVQCNARSQEGQ